MILTSESTKNKWFQLVKSAHVELFFCGVAAYLQTFSISLSILVTIFLDMQISENCTNHLPFKTTGAIQYL